MSITSEIQRIQGNISDAYNACATKNATMPVVQNSAYLADTINSITGGGGAVLIEKNITANGVYNASDDGADGYSSVNVSVASSSIFTRYTVNATGYAAPINSSGTDFFKNITEVSWFSGWVNPIGTFTEAFKNCYGLRGEANFCNLWQYFGLDRGVFRNAFENCYNLSGEVNFCRVHNVSNDCFASAFKNCNHITGVNFANLKTIDGSNGAFVNAFSNCTSLRNVVLGGPFYTIGPGYTSSGKFANAFSNCVNLTNVSITMSYIYSDYSFYQTFNNCGMNTFNFGIQYIEANYALQYCFRNCSNLRSLYFPSLYTLSGTNILTNMLYMCNDVTVHFVSARQSRWSGLADFLAGFGGTNTTVLFDL